MRPILRRVLPALKPRVDAARRRALRTIRRVRVGLPRTSLLSIVACVRRSLNACLSAGLAPFSSAALPAHESCVILQHSVGQQAKESCTHLLRQDEPPFPDSPEAHGCPPAVTSNVGSKRLDGTLDDQLSASLSPPNSSASSTMPASRIPASPAALTYIVGTPSCCTSATNITQPSQVAQPPMSPPPPRTQTSDAQHMCSPPPSLHTKLGAASTCDPDGSPVHTPTPPGTQASVRLSSLDHSQTAIDASVDSASSHSSVATAPPSSFFPTFTSTSSTLPTATATAAATAIAAAVSSPCDSNSAAASSSPSSSAVAASPVTCSSTSATTAATSVNSPCDEHVEKRPSVSKTPLGQGVTVIQSRKRRRVRWAPDDSLCAVRVYALEEEYDAKDELDKESAALMPALSLPFNSSAEDWGADALAEALECVAAWEEARGGVWRSSEASPPDECNRLVPYADASTRTMGGRATRAGVEDAIGGPSALLDGTGASRDQASVQSSRERSRENSDGEIGRKGCVGGGPHVGSGGCSSVLVDNEAQRGSGLNGASAADVFMCFENLMAQETLEEEDGERYGDGDVVDVEHGGVASWRLAAPVSGDGGIDPTAIAGGGCDGGIRAAQAEHGASAGTLAGRAADDASGAGTAQCSPESSVDARFARFAGKSGANDDGVEDCFERQEPAFDAIAEHSDAHNMKPPQPVPLQSSPPQPPPLPRPSRRRAFEISSPLSLTPREDGRSSRLHQRPLEQQRQQQQQQHRRLPSSDSGRASRGARELPSRGKRLVAAATGRQALSVC